MKLNLTNTTTDMDVQTDTDVSKSDTYVTCDTFNTTQSNCSLTSPTLAEDEQPTPLYSDDATQKASTNGSGASSTTTTNGSSLSSANLTPSNALMSDSGVCLLESVKAQTNLQITNGNNNQHYNHNKSFNNSNTPNGSHNGSKNGVGGARTSDEETASCSSCEMGRNSDIARPYCSMHAMRRKIAAQKALIMKKLEMNVNKTELDEQIAELQELQRRYMKMERELMQSNGDDHVECCSTEPEPLNYETMTPTIMRSSVMEESYMPSMTRSCPSMRDLRKFIHRKNNDTT